jgi:hypothetical protein
MDVTMLASLVSRGLCIISLNNQGARVMSSCVIVAPAYFDDLLPTPQY